MTSSVAPLKLAQQNLDSIASRGMVSVPKYDRKSLKAGILHFGVGNFHRAHLAAYLDDLFNLGRSLDWAIVGAGVLPSDVAMREQLAAQDFLTTVVELESENIRPRVIGTMVDFLPVGDSEAIIARIADPAIRIVSLTITEGGYFIHPSTGRFNAAHPAIQSDAVSPDCPRTVFGLIAAGLRRRKEAGTGPLTVLSCDNIPHNGRAARDALIGMAALLDPELAEWIGKEVAFSNGMVDRITPATGPRERLMCQQQFGLDDGWPVFCEGFKQWVVEDNFAASRPELEAVGVQFVSDVSPYELMKIRILNGGHALLAYPAGLLDIHYVLDAFGEPLISQFWRKVELEEIVPLMPPVPGIQLTDYLEAVATRLANRNIGDTVRRLCQDGSNRQPKFIVPSIVDALRTSKPFTGLALESALWCRYCYGVSEKGTPIEPNDPNWSRLQAQARLAKEEPLAWLEMDDIYGEEVAQSQEFRTAFAQALTSLWEKGTECTLREYISNRS